MQSESDKGIRLWELRLGTCRWPLGTTWEHAEYFCGEPAVPGCSWCLEHRKRAFARAAVPARGGRKPMILKDRRR